MFIDRVEVRMYQ